MEHELITLGILFAFALLGSVLASKFKQPMLMGLLLVGALIGPNMFGLITDMHVMDMLIEFGAVLILFILGLEFDIPRLKKLGLKPVILATLNVGFMTFAGFLVGILLGFSVQISFFLGLILSFGSTVIIAKVLENKGMMKREEVPLIIAVLIIDDIIAVMIVTFLSGIQDQTLGLFGSIESLIISIFLLLLAYFLFVKFIKPILSWILARHNNEEIKLFAALAIWAGFAYLAYHLKLSPAVGAFMAGSIVTSIPNTNGLKESIEPYNLIISSFFFIAIGTLISFQVIIDNIMLILLLVLTVIVVKLTAYSTITYLFANMKGDKMFFLSFATFAVGEFSLLIAKESMKFNIGIDLISIAAAVVSISAIIMALTISYSDKVYEPTLENMPYRFRKKMENTSSYIKAVSEQLDLDNRYSQNLKKNLTGVFTGLLASIIIIFGWKKLSEIMTSNAISNNVLMTGYILSMILMATSLFYTLFKCGNVVKSLGEILSNATNIRNQIQNRKIVMIAFSIVGLTIAILGFPFIMFMLNMQKIYMILPGIFMLVMIIQLKRISDATGESHTEYHVSSKRFEFDVKNRQKGWRI
ncbi:MAG: cation:proton antiporter [Candidatus Woesearchaeota archaeon]